MSKITNVRLPNATSFRFDPQQFNQLVRSLEQVILQLNATSPLLQSTTSREVVTSTWRVDPLAQTFFVDPEVYPNGLFVENVKLFFSAKDDSNIPVNIQIRPTVNALPSSDFSYPESVVTKYPFEINTTATPDFASDTSYTKFTFGSPVFLKPGLYALVVLTDSPQYSLWVAEKGGTTVNNQYVSVNPYVGTLYKSQNAMEFAVATEWVKDLDPVAIHKRAVALYSLDAIAPQYEQYFARLLTLWGDGWYERK